MVALFLSSTMLCHPALAQDPLIQLQDINVSQAEETPISGGDGYRASETTAGFKGGVPVTEVPRSVSVVTAQEIEDRTPAQIEDAVAYTPGLNASNWGVDDRFDQFMIRGFETGSTGIFRDGLIQKTLNFSGFKTDPYLAERIDVLRGPSGVMYGPGDAGGMINIITKRPRFEKFGEARLQFGSHNTAQVAVDLGDHNEADTLAWRLTGLTRNGGNEAEGVEDDRTLGALALTWAPTDRTEVTFLGHYQEDSLAPNMLLPVAGEDYAASLGALPESFVNSQHDFNQFDTEGWSVGYQARHEVNSQLSLRQNLRYAKQDTEYRHLYFGGMANANTMQFWDFTVFEEATVLAVDTQVEYRGTFGGAENTLLAGIDYTRRILDGTQGFGSGYQISVTNPSYDFGVSDPGNYLDRKETEDQIGQYVQNHTRFSNGVTVTAGLRKSRVSTETEDRLGGTITTQDDDALTASLGATWDLGNGFVPYASYAEGFTTNIGSAFDGSPFKPTESKQFEAGLRYQPSGRNMLLSAAVFDVTKTNVLTTDPTNSGFQVQTGEIRHKGLELEARGQVTNTLAAIFSYSYIDAEITQSNNGDAGNRTGKVPEHLAALWLDYAFDGPMSGLKLGGGLRYVGESWGDNANTRQVEDYVLADLSVSYAWDDYRVSLGVTNLFDKDYAATCESVGYGCISGEGREITFALSRKF
ncbi:TonB-dependent siderophore receptor [Phaeobacter sp. B1627]|uniref:TonB-dependent siderophore receptor n=1 Tax=Phaeobacter sp. B1627 TaxID=2583809 RepID=UPI00159ED4CA|nr:TonB-dependent siderophore receptor [Phaeobacter sp. B1627]